MVAEGEVVALGFSVEADAVFEPASGDVDERCFALIAGSEDPFNAAFGFGFAAGGADGQGVAGLPVSQQETAAGFAERSIGEVAGECGGCRAAEGVGVVGGGVAFGFAGMAVGAGRLGVDGGDGE